MCNPSSVIFPWQVTLTLGFTSWNSISNNNEQLHPQYTAKPNHLELMLQSLPSWVVFRLFIFGAIEMWRKKKVFSRTAEKEHQIPLFELSFTVSYLLFFRACLSMNPASLLFIIILFSHFHWGRKRAERNLLWLFYKNSSDFSFLVGLSQEWNLWLVHK